MHETMLVCSIEMTCCFLQVTFKVLNMASVGTFIEHYCVAVVPFRIIVVSSSSLCLVPSVSVKLQVESSSDEVDDNDQVLTSPQQWRVAQLVTMKSIIAQKL